MEEIADEDDSYFVSMTDLTIGLLFIFIIMLMYFALKFQDTVDQLEGVTESRSEILTKIKDELESKGLKVKVDLENGILRFPEDLLFEQGSHVLKEDGLARVGLIGEVLVDVLPCFSYHAEKNRSVECGNSYYTVDSMFLEGHTDNVPVGVGGKWIRYNNNEELSLLRASHTYNSLLTLQPELKLFLNLPKDDGGKQILSMSGYGDSRPIKSGNDEASLTLNRRIDLRVIMLTPSDERLKEIRKEIGLRADGKKKD